jgi:hypothetical protein
MNLEMDKEDQYLFTVFLVGVATVAYWCIGLFEMFTGGHHLLSLVGVAFPFFGLALFGLFRVALERSAGGGAIYFAAGGALAGVALMPAGTPAPGLGYAALAAGLLCVARGLLVGARVSGGGSTLSNEEHIGFLLTLVWLFVALLSNNVLAAIRTAALLLVLWHLIPTMARGYARLAAWLGSLFTPREAVEEPAASVGSDYDEYGLDQNDPFYKHKRVIHDFIIQNYPTWIDVSFQPTKTNPAYITHILDKPYTIKSDVFSKREDDLTAALELNNRSLIIRLDGRRNAFLLQIAKPATEVVPTFFDSITEEPPMGSARETVSLYRQIKKMQQQPYGFAVGLDPFSTPLSATITDPMFPHMLVAGTTASGKSVFMHTVLVQAMLNNSPHDLRVLFLDAGQQTQMFYREVPHLWRPLADSVERMVESLKDAVDEMERRQRLWTAAGVVDRNGYLRRYPRDEIPVLFIVIDEGASFTDTKLLKDPYTARLLSILRLGRKYGVHVLVGLQRPMSDTLGVGMKDLLSRRFIFRLESADHSINVLDDPIAAKMRGLGDGLFKHGPDPERFQSFFLPEIEGPATVGHKTVEDYAREIVTRWGPGDFVRDPSAPRASPIEGADGVSPVTASASAEMTLSSEHLRTIDNAGWLVLRGLTAVFDPIDNAYNNPKDFVLTNESLLLYVRRETPDGYHGTPTITPAFISETLTRLSGSPAAKGGRWPDFIRSIVSGKVAQFRQISEREWQVMRGVQAYLGSGDRPNKIDLRAIVLASNKLALTPIAPPLSTDEVEFILHRLIGRHWVEHPDGEGEWATAQSVVKTLVANYGVVTNARANQPEQPVRARPSVDSVASRPPKDPF